VASVSGGSKQGWLFVRDTRSSNTTNLETLRTGFGTICRVRRVPSWSDHSEVLCSPGGGEWGTEG
jgi:hypothetical protein